MHRIILKRLKTKEILILFLSIKFQSNKMNTERQPLLIEAEMQGRSARPRPDVRCSPENTLVDVKSEDDGKLKKQNKSKSNHFILLID